MTYHRVQAPRENGVVHLSEPEADFTLCGRRIDVDTWRAKGQDELPTCHRCTVRIPRKPDVEQAS